MTAVRFRRSLSIAAMSAVFLVTPALSNTDKAAEVREIVAGLSLAGSFLAAQVAGKENDDEAAVAFYQRAVDLDPHNNELKQMLFLALTANGRIEDAVKIAKSAVTAGSDGNVSLLVTAVDAFKRKSWNQVLDSLKADTGSDLDKLVEQLLRGWALFGSGDKAKAYTEMNAITGPDWVVVLRDYHLGLMQSAGGEDADSIVNLEKAVSNDIAAALLQETYLRAIEAQARTQWRAGKQDDARATLKKGIDAVPNHPPFKALDTAFKAGGATSPLVLNAAEGGAEIFYSIGTAIGRQGGASFTQSYLQLAAHLRPGGDEINIALASAFETQKAHERANAMYERISDSSPFHLRAKLEYALNLNEMEQKDEAIATLRTLLTEFPEELQIYSTLGGVLSQHERYAEASEIYEKAIAKIPAPQAFHWNLFYRQAISYERQKMWDKAEPSFKKAIELSPNQADVLNYLGYSWVDMGIHLDEGMDLIRKAVDLKPRSGFIVDSLGWAYYRLGKYEDAVRELERAVELMPQDSTVNDHLGDAYWQVGRKLEATFQWNHALANKPEPEEQAKIESKLKSGLTVQPATAKN